MKTYLFTPDKHIGWERKNGRLEPLHDKKALSAMLKFASDFKPDIWIEGGDNLDCGPVSHWLQNKKVSLKDLDLAKDIKEYQSLVLEPVNEIMDRPNTQKYWMAGNHEEWLTAIGELNPGISEMLKPTSLLPLDGWTYVDQGHYVKLGKLHFVHGDNITGVSNVANSALNLYGHSVRFGHFHTFQAATKYSLFDSKEVKTSVAVPGLCRRNPNYMKNRPNQWMLGFNYGYLHDDGTFHDYTPIIINGKFTAEGRTYAG
jgi:hypothetical protein